MTRVVVLCSDIAEASQIKWIRGLRAAGADVTSFGFRRANMDPGFGPDWPHVPLGRIGNGITPSRLAALAAAVPILRRHRRTLDGADVVLARDLDMALLALGAGVRAPLVYMSLDIHRQLSAPGPAGALARRVERRVLARASRLITSAPDFVARHFVGRQGYAGPVRIVENRILWSGIPPARGIPGRVPGPLRLGWVGTLRCPQSFALLREVAARGDGRIEVILRGTLHRHQLPDFEARLRASPHMRYEGPYTYPDGLPDAYAGLDCAWGQDLWQAGTNSDWLLPNRLWEAGFFAVPLLAVRGTATARRLTADGSGIVLPHASAEAVLAALEGSMPRLQALRVRLLNRDATSFYLRPEEMLAATASHPPPREVTNAA